MLRRLTLRLALGAAFVAPVFGQAPAPPARGVIDAAPLLRDLEMLSADDMQGRQSGTPGGEKARAYVVERFGAAGLQPFGDSYEHPFTFSTGRAPNQVERRGVNVLGRIDGTRTPGRFIVVTAHYDHVGVRNGQIFNGADDNASGTAALFALARYFTANRPANSLIFAALDAEEIGLRGARAFVAKPPVEPAALALNVNMDMIGRDAKDLLYVVGTRQQPFLKPYIERIAAAAPVTLVMGHDDPSRKDVEDWTSDSDHHAFCEAKIPCLYFGVEDFEHHHKVTDDFATMTHAFYVRAVETMVLAVKEFDANLDAVASASGRRAAGQTEPPGAAGQAKDAVTMPATVGRKVAVVLLVGNSPAGVAEALAAQGIASAGHDVRATGVEAVAGAASAISSLRNDSRFSTITVAGFGEAAEAARQAARAARADGVVEVPAAEASASTARIVTAVGDLERPGVRLPRRPAGQRVSLRTTLVVEVSGARIGIEYGRPSKRGREIWGALVPWSRWWMPGADEATTITTADPLAFGSLAVPAGDYTIYTLPSADSMKLIINRETGQFHTVYRPDRDLGRVEMTLKRLDRPVERLTFAVEPASGGGVLKLVWDDREYSAPFVVTRGTNR